jgi:hypothetical protein
MENNDAKMSLSQSKPVNVFVAFGASPSLFYGRTFALFFVVVIERACLVGNNFARRNDWSLLA